MKWPTEGFTRLRDRLDFDDIEFEAFRQDPLDEGALRCIRYMHDVEHHTICYLRDVLVTDAHKDHEITTFMTLWAYQEYFHGEALSAILEAHGEPGSSERVPATRHRNGLHDRLMPMYTFAANAITKHVPAVHMTWGAVNEWTTQAAYGRLATRANHPALSKVLAGIKKQEGAHIDFYASQARRRLGESATARKLTRYALQKFWTPVGAGVMPESEVAHVASYLFAGPDGAETLARLDRRVDQLPGLQGLGLLRGVGERFLSTAA